MVLDHDRHRDLITELREVGCRIRLIPDGDVAGAISTAEPESGADVLFGIGGAPEGVLAAAARLCMGGEIQGQLQFQNDSQRERSQKLMGEGDVGRVLSLQDMARGEVLFAATGVTSGDLLKGVRFFAGGCATHSLVMRSKSGTVRYIEAEHDFVRKPGYTSEGEPPVVSR